jgi:hypothetical protein
VDNDTDLKSLRAQIAAELNIPTSTALDFRNEASATLPLRLLAVQITPPDPGWRLTLPRPVATIMGVRPGESELAGLLIQNHIEIWTIETLRSAMNIPLHQIT